MLLSERRARYRRVLQGDACVHPASVFDAMSARIAESLGFEVGMFAGSTASATVLGAPDIIVLTLTEFADQILRICRASALPLMVDADHGYGNALNVMRTVEECESAGVCGLTIEDTVLPAAFGAKGEAMISVPEFAAKLRAAVAARQDPSLVVIGRTNGLKLAGIPETIERVNAAQDTGVDAIFLVGGTTRAEIEAVHKVCRLPLILGGGTPELSDKAWLAAHGVRVALQGHQPLYASVKAVYDTLKHLREGGSTAALADKVASEALLDVALKQKQYKGWQGEYLK
ncbi:MAG: isocitrate lyase/phosphoenolpyruvate mutase family protein [Burkholderiales bacterium]|nr:isocitrate lyase/phosphoenolpyruvate mutase family protein [Burkholderiales bacterium]